MSKSPLSNPLFIACFIVGSVAAVVLVVGGIPDLASLAGTWLSRFQRAFGSERGPAFTERWHHTAGGFQSKAQMDMVDVAMPRSADSPTQSMFARFWVCIACDPLPPGTSSSRLGEKFVEFLSEGPVAGLISSRMCTRGQMGWTRLAGDGALRLEAVLGEAVSDTGWCASAMLIPPISGTRRSRQADRMACLWLHAEPHARNGATTLRAGLAEWHARLTQAISVAAAFAEFLTVRMGVRTSRSPAVRVGVMLQAPGPMTELVDVGDLRALRGARQSNQFQGYVIANPAGKAAHDAARDMLAQLCDHSMHLSDFESVLENLPAIDSPLPRKEPGNGGRRSRDGALRRMLVAAATACLIAGGVLIAVRFGVGSSSPRLSDAPRTPRTSRVARAYGWKYQTGGLVSSNPAVVGGIVYIGSDDHRVYALNAHTGASRWTFLTGNRVDSSPAVAGGTVYVGSNDDDLYALNAANGHRIWRRSVGDWSFATPAVAEGIVYTGSGDDRIYALDTQTGGIRWTHLTGGSVESSPAVAGGIVYVGSDDGDMYALNARTGAVRWKYPTAGFIKSSPAVVGGIVYVGSEDHNVYALNAVNGHLLWRHRTRGQVDSSPAVAGRIVYVGSNDGDVYALNAVNGKTAWTFPTGDPVVSRPAVADGVVYAGSKDNQVFALNTTTGHPRWVYRSRDAVLSSPAIAHGMVYFGDNDMRIYAINASTGT